MERRRWVVVLGAVAAVAVVVVVAVWAFPPAAASPSCSLPPPTNYPNGEWFTLQSCPATTPVAGHSYLAYEIGRLSDAETITGAFTANLSVGTYLLNGSEMSYLEAHPNPTSPPSSWLWTCGTAPACNTTVHIPPSPVQPFLVVENLNNIPASVTWTKTLSIYYDAG